MYLCVEVGGQKTLICILNPRGRIVCSTSFPTPVFPGEFPKLLKQELYIHCKKHLASIQKVAVATPSVLPWSNLNFKVPFGKLFPKASISTAPAAKLAALAETVHQKKHSPLYFAPAPKLYSHDDWQKTAIAITKQLKPLIAQHNPKLIIFGGPLGLQLNHYKKYLKTAIPDTKFRIAHHKEKSAIYGCFELAKSH